MVCTVQGPLRRVHRVLSQSPSLTSLLLLTRFTFVIRLLYTLYYIFHHMSFTNWFFLFGATFLCAHVRLCVLAGLAAARQSDARWFIPLATNRVCLHVHVCACAYVREWVRGDDRVWCAHKHTHTERWSSALCTTKRTSVRCCCCSSNSSVLARLTFRMRLQKDVLENHTYAYSIHIAFVDHTELHWGSKA